MEVFVDDEPLKDSPFKINAFDFNEVKVFDISNGIVGLENKIRGLLQQFLFNLMFCIYIYIFIYICVCGFDI